MGAIFNIYKPKSKNLVVFSQWQSPVIASVNVNDRHIASSLMMQWHLSLLHVLLAYIALLVLLFLSFLFLEKSKYVSHHGKGNQNENDEEELLRGFGNKLWHSSIVVVIAIATIGCIIDIVHGMLGVQIVNGHCWYWYCMAAVLYWCWYEWV